MKKILMLTFLLLFTVGLAFSQEGGIEAGKFGISLKVLPQAYDEWWWNLYLLDPEINIHYQEIGMVYHISPKVAIKPAVLFGYISYTEDDAGLDVLELTALGLGGTLALDFYFKRFGDAYFFAGPVVKFVRITSEEKQPQTGPPPRVVELNLIQFSALGTLGGQYMFGNHFGVYGRMGLGFALINAEREITAPFTGVTTKEGANANIFFTYQGSIGLIFYLK